MLCLYSNCWLFLREPKMLFSSWARSLREPSYQRQDRTQADSKIHHSHRNKKLLAIPPGLALGTLDDKI